MKITCEHNPSELIKLIGDANFSIQLLDCGSVVVVDCEDGIELAISSEFGNEDAMFTAEALVRLLNQEYKEIIS